MIQMPLTKTLMGNQYFSSLVYKTFVIPARTGKLTLGPATLLLAVPRPNARVNLFGEIIAWLDANLTTDPVTDKVRPLPTNNGPPYLYAPCDHYSLKVSMI